MRRGTAIGWTVDVAAEDRCELHERRLALTRQTLEAILDDENTKGGRDGRALCVFGMVARLSGWCDESKQGVQSS